MILLLCAILLPIRFSLYIQHADCTRGILTIHIFFLPLRFPFRVLRTATGGRQLVFQPHRHRRSKPESSPMELEKFLGILRIFLRADKARRLLFSHLQLVHLGIDVRPGLSDAAATALFTGLLRSLTVLVPPAARDRVQFHLRPDFFSGRTIWRGVCIVSIPLGILLFTGGMVLLASLLEKRQHPSASKEATHGSSHW